MVRKHREILGTAFIFIGISIIFASFMVALSPRFSFLGRLASANDLIVLITEYRRLQGFSFFTRFFFGTVFFIVAASFSSLLTSILKKYLHRSAHACMETALFDSFIERLRFCYTLENFIEAIRQGLEYEADCSVLITDLDTSFIYTSPAAFVADSETYKRVTQRFSAAWMESEQQGFYFFDEKLALTTNMKKARGVLVAYKDVRFLIVCRYIRSVDTNVFPRLFAEYESYYKREKTLRQLLYYSQLAEEWNMVAQTQRAFLPQKIPQLDMLEIGVCFRPLINVSGDFYDIIPIDKHRTLIVTGDVSGKGFAAALVMGVVVNTIKTVKDKEDLQGLVFAIDTAIKRMRLQDKYAVVFLGIIDTRAMNIRYVNASMQDPMILTQAPEGYRVKVLESNCSVVGIIDIDEITVEEKPLYRNDLIIIASDGISEITNDKGVELGETEHYISAIKSFAGYDAQILVSRLADFGLEYSAKNAFSDDITILAVKVGS